VGQVFAGATLTIDPGVRVLASGDVGLYVEGTLSAVGTASQPITFTSSNTTSPSPGNWMGLYLNGSGASGSQLSYVSIQDAGRSWNANDFNHDYGGWECPAGNPNPGPGGSGGYGCITTALLLNSTAPTLNHLTINDSQTDWLHIQGSVPEQNLGSITFANTGAFSAGGVRAPRR
jgi:hypothetical protein